VSAGRGDPPPIYLRWCPKCGYVDIEMPPDHEERCEGEAVPVRYEPVRRLAPHEDA